MLKSASKSHLSIIASIALVGTFGMSGCSSSSSSSSSDVVTSTISGTVSDGTVVNAAVTILDAATGAELATTTTSSDNGQLGDYTSTVSGAGNTVIIRAKGGTDTGPDGIINGNDRPNKSELKTVTDTPAGGGSSTANATPATTLIARSVENQVAKGETVDTSKASKTVSTALGLPEGTNLVELNPSENALASRAAAFVANIVDTMPDSVNPEATFESVLKRI